MKIVAVVLRPFFTFFFLHAALISLFNRDVDHSLTLSNTFQDPLKSAGLWSISETCSSSGNDQNSSPFIKTIVLTSDMFQ